MERKKDPKFLGGKFVDRRTTEGHGSIPEPPLLTDGRRAVEAQGVSMVLRTKPKQALLAEDYGSKGMEPQRCDLTGPFATYCHGERSRRHRMNGAHCRRKFPLLILLHHLI